jgi:phosphopantothenoylcysteine decarboxylase / phosphopantothenate---cysteine ligase
MPAQFALFIRSHHMRFLVTAGPTCEDIDDVRFITNRSTGIMGYTLAEEATRRGHEVILISGPANLQQPSVTDLISVRSAQDMFDACLGKFQDCDAVLAAAAVSDYRPAKTKGKIKKTESDMIIRLSRTPDILAELGLRKSSQLLVGFALEVDKPRQNAEKKLREKHLDAIVLNTPASFGAETSDFALLLSDGTWKDLGRISKRELAAAVVDLVERMAAEQKKDT